MAGLFQNESHEKKHGLLTLNEAASAVGRPVTLIAEYLRRGRITPRDASGHRMFPFDSDRAYVRLKELERFIRLVERDIEKYQAEGLDADLGFFDVPERERTKHVHRLHPYLGKFIPQLVEHFLSRHFQPGQWVLDPFMGSGTTLIQAHELGLNAIGIDISEFNCKIAEVKTRRYSLDTVESDARAALRRLEAFAEQRPGGGSLFRGIDADFHTDSAYLNRWYSPRALQEILFYRSILGEYRHSDVLKMILSRSARSARLIPHYDLATPKEPVRQPYYCFKHKRTCQPTDECLKFLQRYTVDTVRRLREFDRLRTAAEIRVVHGDSRAVELPCLVDGVFSSPPYVGQIDYHEQHAYAYELFGIPRRDDLEIGPKSEGKSASAQEAYVDAIAGVVRNIRRFVRPGRPLFFVANDRLGLYPEIARRAGCRIEAIRQRAVSKRTERDKRPYSESIFQFAEKRLI